MGARMNTQVQVANVMPANAVARRAAGQSSQKPAQLAEDRLEKNPSQVKFGGNDTLMSSHEKTPTLSVMARLISEGSKK